MILPSARAINLLAALTGIFILAISLYLEHTFNLHPCSLCLLQRAVLTVLTVLLFSAFLHNPNCRGIKIYGFLTLFGAVLGVFLAARQVWLQSLPRAPAEVCMPGFSYIVAHLPLHQALSAMLMGSDNCGVIDWTFWGWSLARWSLACFVVFGIVGALQIFSKPQPQ